MQFPRASGILFHPTSLPGRWGIGDLGPQAYAWIDWLAAAGQQLWQVLPLGPTGYGDSPYQCFSAFAGNPLLISPDLLLEQGLLQPADVADAPGFPDEHVDYGRVIDYKRQLLDRAFARYVVAPDPGLRDEFNDFRASNAHWLNDYALFIALKNEHDGAVWNRWETPLARHDQDGLIEASRRLRHAMQREEFAQWLFFRQWQALRSYANARGIRVIGDIPIFVAFDSADVWANRELFFLDEDGNSTVIAGVPPDYFSATGQRWGNPLYRWDIMADQGYQWWVARLRASFQLYDIVRIDHFRGFEAYWEVPAEEETAINGRWVPGPGIALFTRLEAELGELPIIAEDLGVITPEVEDLRDQAGFPGMRVLQFAFGGSPDASYLPHNYVRNCVVYSGTHDNDTTRGWFLTRSQAERSHIQRYLGISGHDISWDLIRAALASIANTAVVPLQDVLSLTSKARMNTPGAPSGNWTWRLQPGQLTEPLAVRLYDLTWLYGRAPALLEETSQGVETEPTAAEG